MPASGTCQTFRPSGLMSALRYRAATQIRPPSKKEAGHKARPLMRSAFIKRTKLLFVVSVSVPQLNRAATSPSQNAAMSRLPATNTLTDSALNRSCMLIPSGNESPMPLKVPHCCYFMCRKKGCCVENKAPHGQKKETRASPQQKRGRAQSPAPDRIAATSPVPCATAPLLWSGIRKSMPSGLTRGWLPVFASIAL